MAKLAICSIIRNEELYLDEWVAFHLLQGVSHFLIFDDRSSDRTIQILSRLCSEAEIKFGTTIEIVNAPNKTTSFDEDQKQAYLLGATHLTGKVDFVAFIDADEFVFSRTESSVSRELDSVPNDVSAIAICQRVFGSSGQRSYYPSLVTERFVHCTTEGHEENRWFKTIARPGDVAGFFSVHRALLSRGRYVLSNGAPLLLETEQSAVTQQVVFGPIYLNHYMLKSKEEYQTKKIRGGQRGLEERYTEVYYEARNTAEWANACLKADMRSVSPLINGVIAELGFANVALGGFATQSSTSEWSSGLTAEQDAAGAIDGCADGRRKFHTAMEENPWWEVDLGGAVPISEIRIFNTTHPVARHRFRNFQISLAIHRSAWIDVFKKQDDSIVGGIDSCPFIWRPELWAFARFIRITAVGICFLHLDQVEIYGNKNKKNGSAWTISVPEVDDTDLFSNFVSLGDNCEFGLVQNQIGLNNLDLFRFGGTGPDESGLIECLNDRFLKFATDPDLNISIRPGGGSMTESGRYKFEFHTDISPADTLQDGVLARERRRLSFLAKKLVGDLELAEKIFVRKSNKPVSLETMLLLYAAMKTYGRPELLWVALADDDHPHGTVERLRPGFFVGYIRRLAPYNNANDVHLDEWRDICVELLRQRAISRMSEEAPL